MCHLSNTNLPPFNVNVLVVDDDATALDKTIQILTSLNYKAVGTKHSSLALDKLRNHQEYFQLIVMEVHMPDLDGFKLKQIIDEEFGIPIIMISVDNSEEIQKKALMSGVMRYILKPAKPDDFVGIWQFAIVAMKGKMPTNTKKVGDIIEESSINGENNLQKELSCSSSIQEDKRVEEKSDDMEQSSVKTRKKVPKKTKVVWTKDLQSQFLKAIDILGPEDTIPTKILQVMNVKGLTKANVASHLQKYRLHLKRIKRIYTSAIEKAKEENDIFFVKMATAHSPILLQLIEEDLQNNMKQSKMRSVEYIESNNLYKSHLRSKLSSVLGYTADNCCCNEELNPSVKIDFAPSNVNSIVAKPYPQYPNANDANQQKSASNICSLAGGVGNSTIGEVYVE